MHDRLISDSTGNNHETQKCMDGSTVDINEYQYRVMKLFQSGKATPIQWAEMARAVMYVSEKGDEDSVYSVENIDADVLRDDFGRKIQEKIG